MPVTATEPVIVVEARETGTALARSCVSVRPAHVKLTGWVACQKVPLTGWVACQNVPVTGNAPLGDMATTSAGSVATAAVDAALTAAVFVPSVIFPKPATPIVWLKFHEPDWVVPTVPVIVVEARETGTALARSCVSVRPFHVKLTGIAVPLPSIFKPPPAPSAAGRTASRSFRVLTVRRTLVPSRT